MSMQFDESTNNTGGCQQVRSLMRVDATQWPNWKIANSFNNWLDFLAGYAIGADGRFQWDSTNHTKLPEGTTDLVAGQSDYSFLTDEQGNKILTLIGLALIDATSKEYPLDVIDRADDDYDKYAFGKNTGTPTRYDKIADNIVRLDFKPSAADVSTYDLKFYFQRAPYYYVSTDTTRTSGFSPILDRGFVIAAAYDGALTLGLKNLQALSIERQFEQQKVVDYFGDVRNRDETTIMRPQFQEYE